MRMGPFAMAYLATNNYNVKLREKSVKGDYRVVEMNYDVDDKKDDKKEDAKEKAKDDKKD